VYCTAPLLLKACPSCTVRCFHGHQYCPACGAGLEVAGERDSERPCPRCNVPLAIRQLGDLQLDDCPKCGGTFVDRHALETLVGEKRAARADSVLGAYDTGGDAPLPQPAGAFYIKCPDCGQTMNRRTFATGARVIVDICRAHGTWFDQHELPRIIKFVMKGGLEHASKKDLANQRAELERERARLADESPAWGGVRRNSGSYDVSASFLGSFFAELLK
jgi:Zn-finger nucleic acid-binding protein